MSGAEVHQLPEPEPSDLAQIVALLASIAVDIEHGFKEHVGKPLYEILDEVNRWRNGQYVAWKDDPPKDPFTGWSSPPHFLGELDLNLQHATRTLTDSHGRAPIVQVLPESDPMRTNYRGEIAEVIAWAVDADGHTWPMLRSDSHPRPTIVRDAGEGMEPGW